MYVHQEDGGLHCQRCDDVYLYRVNEINSLSYKNLTKTRTHQMDDLKVTFDKMKKSLNKYNDISLLKDELSNQEFRPSLIYLTDLNICVRYCIFSDLEVVDSDKDLCDIKISSESLNNVMKNAWGFGTLMVNGRFQANYKTFDNFVNQTRLYYMNNIGKYFPRDIKIGDITNSPSLVKKIISLGEK